MTALPPTTSSSTPPQPTPSPPPPVNAPPPVLPVSPPPTSTNSTPPIPPVNPPNDPPPPPVPLTPPIDPPTPLNPPPIDPPTPLNPPSAPPNDPPPSENPPPPSPRINSPPPVSASPPISSTPPSPPSNTTPTPSPPSNTTPPPSPPSNTTPPLSPPSSIPLPPFAPPPTNSTSPTVPSRSPPPTPPSNGPPTLTTPPPPTTHTLSPPSTFVPPSRPPPASSSVPPSNSTVSGYGTDPSSAKLFIGLVVVFLFLGAIGMFAWFVWKKRKRHPGQSGGHIMPTNIVSAESDAGMLKVQISPANNQSDSPNGILYSPCEPGGMGYSRSWFTYDELHEATNGFSAQNVLGEGGFGCVYKGILTDGRLVAVKQLKIGGGQGEREFRAEVDIISRIHHRHLVSLVGYCISDDNRLLVYEYVANDTLYFHLHGEGRPVLDWATRVKIAIGSARGLAYLHEDCHPRVIHRDIKSSNILIDNNFEARVADFGLAKLAMDANSHITTRVMGTFGYMAPEYASSGKLTEKSDVFSFGVVLLELITGRKSVDTTQPLGEESLVEWARPLLSKTLETEELETLADPKLHGDYVGGEMFRMVQAAAACVRHSSSKRPKMGQVVRAFDNMVAADLTNGMRVGESRLYNTAEQSAEIRLFQRMAFGSQEYSTDMFGQSSSGESDRVNSQRN